MPVEGEAAPQRVSLPQTLLRTSWRENGFFLVRLLLNLVMVSLPIYVFRLPYKEMEAILNCSFHISPSEKVSVFFKIYQLVTIIANSLISRPGNVTV